MVKPEEIPKLIIPLWMFYLLQPCSVQLRQLFVRTSRGNQAVFVKREDSYYVSNITKHPSYQVQQF